MIKKWFFTFLILFQILLLFVFTQQVKSIDQTGVDITLAAQVDTKLDLDDDGQSLFLEFDINHINKEEWHIHEEDGKIRPIYVRLKEAEDGLFVIHSVTREKPKKLSEENPWLLASYYGNQFDDSYHVHYHFQWIEHAESFGDFSEGDRLKVRMTLGKYGQVNVRQIEQIDR